MWARRATTSGFTIIETMAVVALLLLIAGVALPVAMRDNPRGDMDEARRRIQAAVMIARAEAQRSGVVQRVVVETDAAGVVWLGRAPRMDEAGDGLFTRVNSIMDLPSGVSIEGGTDAVEAGVDGEGVSPSMRIDPDFMGESKLGPSAREGSPRMTDEDQDADLSPIEMALCLPDGSVWLTGDPVCAHADGLRASIALMRWTGRVALEPIEQTDPNEPVPAGGTP